MKAIVLAGGFGTRIQPLTNSVPKPMLPILNRPMMEHIIIKLRDELNITEIAVLLYFKPEIIKEYFKDGKDLGVNITYFLPDDDYGTAGAVAFARDFLDETFVIASGDLVTNFNFKEIKKFHDKKKSKLTITLTPVENPLEFGVVIANEKTNQIERFLEKPSWGEVFSDTINTGIYFIEPEILDYIPFSENFDFAKDLFPLLMKEGVPLWGCPMKGYWRDVGNPISYRDVYKDIFDGLIELPFKGEKQKLDKAVVYLEQGVKLPEQIRADGVVVIGKGSKIADGVTLENVCLGSNVNIKKHTELIDCVVWDKVQIGTKTKLKNSVLCNDNIIKDEIKVPHGVVIAEKCEIGKKASFEKDLIVWPEKIIAANSVVNNNVIWGTKYKSSIFEEGKVKGRTNIELSIDVIIKIAESFGSTLPVGSTVYLSRDYHKSSRMLKRAFLSGMLSTGINVIDLQSTPSNVMRYRLQKNDEIVAGVHFRHSVQTSEDTEVIIYGSNGLTIDSKVSKSIEKLYFKEAYRRVNHTEVGEITEEDGSEEIYIDAVLDTLDLSLFKNSDLKVSADIMFGSTSYIYPIIMNELGIENVVLNAYKDDKKLSGVGEELIKTQKNMENITRAMGLDCAFLIYPNGHKLQIIDDKGELVYDYIALLAVLDMIDKYCDHKIKVLLPAWGPDFVKYKNIEIIRDKRENYTATELFDFDLIANTDGHFAFTNFGLNRDAVYSSFRILEILQKSGKKLSKTIEKLPKFTFKGENVPCPSEAKGKMMRKFLGDAGDKKIDTTDGVKTWVNEDEWILMVPDDNRDFLNIYIQAETEKSASKIFWKYQDKIEKWLSE